jgi:hypothetical protein
MAADTEELAQMSDAHLRLVPPEPSGVGQAAPPDTVAVVERYEKLVYGIALTHTRCR